MNDQRTFGRRPVFHHHATGLRALDTVCGGLPIGALTQVSGRHAADVDRLLEALRGADSSVVLLDVQYEVVTTKYRSVIEALQGFHLQRKPVIVRCSPPRDSFGLESDGEEALLRAVATVARIYSRPIVLAWCGQPGAREDDEDELALWMAMMNVGTLIDARREDEEDDVAARHLEDVDVLFAITVLDPSSGGLSMRSLYARDIAR